MTVKNKPPKSPTLKRAQSAKSEIRAKRLKTAAKKGEHIAAKNPREDRTKLRSVRTIGKSTSTAKTTKPSGAKTRGDRRRQANRLKKSGDI